MYAKPKYGLPFKRDRILRRRRIGVIVSPQKKKRRNALRDDDRPTKRATSLDAPKNDG